MIPQVKPEIYLLIAQHVKRSFPVHQCASAAVEHAIDGDQKTLLNLMKVSKSCMANAPPYDFKLFVAGLRTNEHIDRTSRLHIRQERLLLEIEIDCAEVSYAEIFESGWTRRIRDLSAMMQECHSLIGEGMRIRQFITEGLTVLPNLRTVSMGGIGDDLFCITGGYQVQSMYSCNFENGGKVLSHALIDLPTIHHYCQTVAYGPLALPHKILKVKSPLKTFTHHLRGTQIFSRCLDAQEKRSPPIILGSMNRYYCQAAFHAPYPFTDECKVEIAVLLKLIIAMFNRSVYIADPTTGVPIKHHGDSNVLDGTQIEIYDYIRAIESSKTDRSTKACINPADDIQTLPPQSLSFPQRILDQILSEQWKGKVVLKNREQAPPSPACGLNLQEEFKDVFKYYKSMWASSDGKASAYVTGQVDRFRSIRRRYRIQQMEMHQCQRLAMAYDRLLNLLPATKSNLES